MISIGGTCPGGVDMRKFTITRCRECAFECQGFGNLSKLYEGSRRSNAILSTHEMEGQGKFPSGIGKSSRMTGKGRGSERCLSCQMDRPSQIARDRKPQTQAGFTLKRTTV
jgi:hypothetical protein